MGLDIYLYRYAGDREKIAAEEKAFDEEESALYAQHKGDGDVERRALKKAIKKLHAAHGYVGDGNPRYEIFRHKAVTQVEHDSKLHPKHLFKVGYFRSSYNAGGVNSVAEQNGFESLDYVMGREGDDYEFTPDWHASFKRATTTAARIRELQESGKAFRVLFEGAVRADTMPKSKEQAMAIVLDEFFPKGKKREKDPFDGSGYQNATGSFYPKGLKVMAIIPGVEEDIIAKVRGQVGYRPGAYVVTKEDLEWYAQAYDIVAETCAYVLAQPDIASYRLHWSG